MNIFVYIMYSPNIYEKLSYKVYTCDIVYCSFSAFFNGITHVEQL